MLKGDLPYRVKEFHDRYGSVVRVAPDELSFIEPTVWKDIYMNREFLRPDQWGKRPPGITAHNLISAPVADHARFRKALGPAFSDKAIREHETTILAYVNLLVSRLREKITESGDAAVVNLVEWINYTTFDIISDLGWGVSFQCLEKAEYHPWITVILQFKALLIGTAIKFYPLIDALIPYITPKSAMAALIMVMETGESNVKQRLSRKTDRKDVISYILANNESSPSTVMSEPEMVQNSTALIVAGSEPLTTALAGTLNCLLANPSAMEKLVRELRSAFTSDADISSASTKSLTYLTAVLNEGMRMCPPVPDGMRRAIPRGGATIGGYALPEGIAVSMPCWATFQSTKNFSNPAEFHPERWLDDPAFSKDRKAAFQPFSLGPHNCIGQPLAWVEMRVILAKLLWNFHVELPRGKRGLVWTEQDIWWSWDKKPVEVRITKTEWS